VLEPGGRVRFTRVLAACTALLGRRFDVLEAQLANSSAIALRMLRYVFYNPVRAGLTDDPWRWIWSSLRDLGGATYPAWTPMARVAAALHVPQPSLLRTLTTTADLRPSPPGPPSVDVASVPAIIDAVSSCLRISRSEILAKAIGRRLVVQTCFEIGNPSARRLAQTLGFAERTIRHLRHSPHPALGKVLLCLGDPRLRDPLL
jgi:hypothetical protein